MALSQKGVDIRQTGTAVVFRTLLQTSAGALLGTGTTVLSLIELQSDGIIKSYDFNDNTFKTTALTTPTLAMTHRPSNNAGTTTGVWTVALATVSGFTAGGIYLALVNNSGASPTDQCREFQYGGAEGDVLVTAGSTGQAYVQGDVRELLGTAWLTPGVPGTPDINVKSINAVSASAVTTVKAVQGLAADGVVTTVTNQLTAAAIATGVWQDVTSGDFTVSGSIGKSLFTSGAVPGAAGGLAIVGSAMTLASSAVQAIWDAATSALTTAGSIGKAVLDSFTTLLSRFSSSRAGYLDNLNVGGPVASQADVQAVNQSASKHLLIQTVGQYERPESGNVTYTVEVRTFNALTGAAVNADTTPTVSPVGSVSGDLSANLGAGSNPATGVYRYVYTVASSATVEQIRFDASAAISSATFTLSCFSQVVDMVSATWTSTDATHLTAVYNKLPTNNIADETVVLAAIAAVQADTDDLQNRVPAALVGGRMDVSIGAQQTGVDFTAAQKTSLNNATPAATVSDKTGFSLVSAYDFAKGTVAMAEAYAANGAAPTPVQALYGIQQYLATFLITGTSYTVKKLDGSTTAFVVTLNDANNPTGATRA